MTHTICELARAWAAADRAADDRAADIQGLERVIALEDRLTPELKARRSAALAALREACQAENAAEEALQDAARGLLDLDSESEVMTLDRVERLALAKLLASRTLSVVAYHAIDRLLQGATK